MGKPVLRTVGLTKSFGSLQASRAISIDLLPGEIHAVIGPNGAGKSTLINLICGTLRPDAGQVIVGDRDVSALKPPQRARAGLGRTFQISALAMEDSVLQNAMLGALGASGQPWRFWTNAMMAPDLRDTAEQSLARVGLADQRNMRVADLSHGQRRKLEVAVALTLAPQAFIMDEPMAGMGAGGSVQLTHMLDELRHEAPILLVEHDMDAVFALADRISVLVYGQIIATGTVEEIRANETVRKAYLGEDA